MPGAVATIAAFADTTVKAGVEHLVLLSGRGEPEAEAAEQAVQEAGTEWTIVRCGWFSQNWSESAYSHGDDEFPWDVPLLEVTHCIGDFAQFVGPVDHRRHLPCLYEVS